MSEHVDPVRARRARIGHAVAIAQRVGYAALAVAVIAFVIGLSTNFPGWAVTLSIAALVAGIVILPVPIVMGYGVRAAEREDRQASRQPTVRRLRASPSTVDDGPQEPHRGGVGMRYRRFGTSELEVSEVGFGTWTLASDWWGHVEDKQGMLHAAFDAGITFIDTAPVYGNDGVGESMLTDLLTSHRDEIVLTTKFGYDIDAARQYPGQSERPQDWRPESLRAQLEDSLRRLGTEYIDLYQLHNARIEPILDDDLWAELENLRSEGKVRELGVALGPAIGWVEEGLQSVRLRPVVSLQTVFNIIEQEPGLTFAREPSVTKGAVGMIARVPHASDVLTGKVTPDTVFPKEDHRSHRNHDNMLDNFEKAETLTFLWEDSDRTIGQAAIAGILANPAFTTVLPTCVTPEEIDEYAAGSDFPLTAEEAARVDELFSRNFDHEDRYEMPLKSSV